MATTIKAEELAWAAGFFDGEGWTGIITDKRNGVPSLQMAIGQANDRAVLDRFMAATGGIGKVYGPYPDRKSRVHGLLRTDYRFGVVGLPKVQAVIAQLWTWLSDTKRDQYRRALAIRLAYEKK